MVAYWQSRSRRRGRVGRVGWPLQLVLLVLVSSAVSQSAWMHENEDLVSTSEAEAVVGRTATLPCDVEPDTNEDRVYMVLWFRQSGSKPFYSFDVRGRSFNKALHWSDPAAFGRRAYFVTLSRPAALTLDHVQLDDEGIYRCRVDFKNSPTRNFQIQLNVVVPPHQMLLYDEDGRDLPGFIGPVEEGGNFTLLCEMRGGRPQPNLTWLLNDQPIKDHEIIKNDGKVIISKITLLKIERKYLNNYVRCQAVNTALQTPHERTARIEMRLKPTHVKIIQKPKQMTATVKTELVCITNGSRPSASISWYRGNRRYSPQKVMEFNNDTLTLSRMVMNPDHSDHGELMICRAVNSELSISIEDSFQMDVIYKPVVNITLGSTLNEDDIKEGDDVYFECLVKANPREYRISWQHNDIPVVQNLSAGVFISTKSLVIQKVTKANGGIYACVAANHLGETVSQSLFLRVQYVPHCAQPSPVLIGARIDQPLRVKCAVSADPSDVAFSWQFNNSGESFQVSPARYAASGTSSELRYRAASERDYGALLCMANNSVGAQKKPCIFQIVPASRPSPPRNCTAKQTVWKNKPYISIKCLTGYDGGITQHFTLDIVSVSQTHKIVHNASAKYRDTMNYWADLEVYLNVTVATLETLMKEDDVLAVVARNPKGPSDSFLLPGIPIRDPTKKTEPKEVAETTKYSTAGALAGVGAVITAVGAVFTLGYRRRIDTSPTSKRPSQSVVQVDSQGRRYLIAYPTPADKEAKPDILNPKNDSDPPRVVLESIDHKSYTIREVAEGHNSRCTPQQEADTVPPR